jgi:hypothetical protein
MKAKSDHRKQLLSHQEIESTLLGLGFVKIKAGDSMFTYKNVLLVFKSTVGGGPCYTFILNGKPEIFKEHAAVLKGIKKYVFRIDQGLYLSPSELLKRKSGFLL